MPSYYTPNPEERPSRWEEIQRQNELGDYADYMHELRIERELEANSDSELNASFDYDLQSYFLRLAELGTHNHQTVVAIISGEYYAD